MTHFRKSRRQVIEERRRAEVARRQMIQEELARREEAHRVRVQREYQAALAQQEIDRRVLQEQLRLQAERLQWEEEQRNRVLAQERILNQVQEEYQVTMLKSDHPVLTPLEYRGIYGEVVVEDTYGLRTLDFIPDVVLDIGACIGIFSRFARELFPGTQIIALEPDPWNLHNFLLMTPEAYHIESRKCALGNGPVWERLASENGSARSYLSIISDGLREALEADSSYALSDVETVTLPSLLSPWSGKTVVLKIDCEGGENAIYCDVPSLEALQTVEYVAMELHGPPVTPVRDADRQRGIESIIESLSKTHSITHHPPILCARRHP